MTLLELNLLTILYFVGFSFCYYKFNMAKDMKDYDTPFWIKIVLLIVLFTFWLPVTFGIIAKAIYTALFELDWTK